MIRGIPFRIPQALAVATEITPGRAGTGRSHPGVRVADYFSTA